MTWNVFAMDTWFRHSLGTYPFEIRCEMLAELGFDATYLTLFDREDWADVHEFATANEYGLDIAGLYQTVDVTDGPSDEFLDLVAGMDHCDTVELALQNGDPETENSDYGGDEAAVEAIRTVLDATTDETVSLYPHVGHWLERVADAVRLCERVDHPRLGATFPSFHWYAVDGSDLPSTMDLLEPHLASVNVCGTRKPAPEVAPFPATIEPLGQGELDNFVLLGELRRVGYDGRVGFQGYSVGGDVYGKLERSLERFRDMERRLDDHPSWADIDFE